MGDEAGDTIRVKDLDLKSEIKKIAAEEKSSGEQLSLKKLRRRLEKQLSLPKNSLKNDEANARITSLIEVS